MEIATFLVALTALLISLVSIGMQLISCDVMETLDYKQLQQLPDMKRQIARYTFFVAAFTLPFAIYSMIALPWLFANQNADVPKEYPWWLQGWALFTVAIAYVIVRLAWCLLRVAILLGEPNKALLSLRNDRSED